MWSPSWDQGVVSTIGYSNYILSLYISNLQYLLYSKILASVAEIRQLFSFDHIYVKSDIVSHANFIGNWVNFAFRL